MSDFGVSKALSDLSDSDVRKVVQFIIAQGVTNESYLSELEVEDFTENEILSKVQARRLIKYWKKNMLSSGEKSGNSGINQSVTGNVGKLVAAGNNVNETNYNAETFNKVEKVDKMQAGGKQNNLTTTFSGEVTGRNMHFGIGNVNEH